MRKIILSFSILSFIFNSSLVNAESLIQPSAPTYEICQQTPVNNGAGGTFMQINQSCVQRNAAKQRDHQLQMSAYYEAQRMQQQANQGTTAQQAELANQQRSDSAKELAESAKKKNEKSSKIYKIAAIASAAASGYYAVAYAQSCSGGGTCNNGHLVKSIAFAVFAALAYKQARSNESVAHEACLTAGKLSTDGGGCSSPTLPPLRPGDPPDGGLITEVFSPDGRCLKSPAECNAVIGNLPPGVSIREGLRGLNSIASSKAPFRIKPDGTVTLNNGKTLPTSSFTSVPGLVAAGMTPAEAKSFMDQLKKQGVDASALANSELKKDSGYGSLQSGNVKSSGAALNGWAENVGDIIDKNKREMTSVEGLSREFNGERIGVAGDDIFKMMNRRYRLKTVQESFILP